MDESKDIEGLITEFEDNHSDWLDRMDDDFDLFTLAPYTLDTDSVNVTSNEPRVFADKIIQTLEGAEMLITVSTPEESAKKKARFDPAAEVPFPDANGKEKETVIEHLCYGLLSLADKRLRRNKIIHGRSCVSAQWFYGAVRGAMVQRILMLKDDGKFVPDIMPVDPRYFAFGIDKDGMEWAATTSWRDPDTIYSEYGVRVEEVSKVIDYWDYKSNIIKIGNTEDKDTKKQKHNLGRVPFIFVPVGSTPLIYDDESNIDIGSANKYSKIEAWGESIFASGRGMYEVKNLILSIWASLLQKSHKRSCFILTQAGKLPLEKVPWGKDIVVPLPFDSKIEWINPPDIANTAPKFYDIIDREIQKADLATIEYGLVQGTEYPSGKAIINLQEGRDSKVTPLLKAASNLWADSFEYLCDLYEKKSSKITVRGYDSRKKLFYEDIKSADIKKPWDIDVKFVATSPEKDMQNVAKAQILKQIGLPDDYIYSEVLQMQDPQKPARQRRLQELEMTNPLIKTMHQWLDAKKEGQVREAEVLEVTMMKMLQEMQAQLGAPPQAAQPQMAQPEAQPPMMNEQPPMQPPVQQGVMPNG